MGDTGSTETESDPWEGLQPYLTQGFSRLSSDVLNTPQFVGFDPAQEQALQMRTARATGGNPLLPAAQQQIGATLGGDYLGRINPYLDELQESVMSQVMPGIDSQFGGASGRFGSPAHAEALGRGVSRGMAPYLFDEFGRQYGDERNRMMMASQAAPGLAREDYYDMMQLGEVGGMRRALEQERITEPGRRVQQYLAALSGTAPLLAGTGTTTTTESMTPLGMGLAGAGMTAQMAGAMAPLAFGGAACWVARAVYGEDNPAWMDFRTRMLSRAPRWFVRFYIKHGPAIADVVKRVPLLKKVLRPLMDRAWR